MKAHTANIKDVTISSRFWNKYRKLVRKEILNYQWEVMNDQIEGAPKSHCIENFRIAAGEKNGKFYGAVFQDSDAAKWLEAAAYCLEEQPDEELKRRADELISLIGRAQQPDGYFNTYYILEDPLGRFTNLREGHELYTLGHMIEAAVAYSRATQEQKFLEIVCRMADLVCETFGKEEGKRTGMPGHPEIELALVKLYDATGKKRYLELAKYFVDVRGTGEKNYFLEEMKRPGQKFLFPELSDYCPEFAQAHLPVREQKTAEGHAVRAVYLYCAMADLAEKYKDRELFNACETLMENIVSKRMYVTGGIGSSGILERFTTDYDLPNEYGYSESCASIGLALFARRMLLITKDGAYGDIMERALYNTVLAGISQDGKHFFYVNPLSCWPESCMERTSKEHVKSIRQKWFGVACCPANISRTLASLGEYIYSYEKDTLYFNLFVAGSVSAMLESGKTELEIRTDFPWNNKVEIEVKQAGVSGCTKLAVRIPEYAEAFHVEKTSGENDLPADIRIEKGYAYFPCEAGTVYTVLFGKEEGPFRPRFLHANPEVREDAGKVCIACGPLIYAAEEADNGKYLSSVYVDTSKPPHIHWEDILGGTLVIEADGKKIVRENWKSRELYAEHDVKLKNIKMTFIPYAYWNNRREGEMEVWVKEYPDF